MLKKLHHVAYRCRDAQETVDFYTKALGLKYSLALSGERVPSTRERCPHLHVFFEMEDGSNIAFFELSEAPEMQLDPNTPNWVQHLALEVEDEAAMATARERLEHCGVPVIGPIDHAFCQSIYFFDPSGHRLELTYRTETPEMMRKLADVAAPMLEAWNRTKQHVPLADWVHPQTAPAKPPA